MGIDLIKRVIFFIIILILIFLFLYAAGANSKEDAGCEKRMKSIMQVYVHNQAWKIAWAVKW